MYTEIDKLNRTAFIDTLEKIIDKKFADFEGFSFAIDGRWGCGKTFIINMLEERIKQKYLVINYNCWKHDYYEEPVEAIMSVIADRLNEIAAEENPPSFANKKSFKILAKFMLGTNAELFRAATNIDLQKIIDEGEAAIKNEYAKTLSKDFESKDPINRAIKSIIFALSMAHCDKKVLFIVDELDRCLPEYAIKVLERLHHVNEGSKFVTLLSINKNELAGSIAKVFGKEQDYSNFADYYLQKFTDTIIPVPAVKQTNTVLDKFKLSKGYFDLNSDKFFCDDFQNFFSNVVGTIPVRSIETIDKQINTINSLIGPMDHKPTEALFCLAILKVYEIIFLKVKLQLSATPQNYQLEFKKNIYDTINSRKEIYNIDAFEKALTSWSSTSCREIGNDRGVFSRTIYISNSLKLQDYVKSEYNDERLGLKMDAYLSMHQRAYLKEFSKWLDQFSCIS